MAYTFAPKLNMAHAGRPIKHDPKVDEIRQAITYSTIDAAIEAISHSNVNILDGEGRTPLIHAFLEGKLPVAEWLVANGANINHQDRNGSTALHFAVQKKRVDLVEFLLRIGAEVDVRDIHGNTPLWRAVFDSRGNYEIVNMLIASKADPNSKNNADRSPFDFAVQTGDTVLEKLLKDG